MKKPTRSEIEGFMKACPVCGAGVNEHFSETDDAHEGWTFYCYGEVLLIQGRLVESEPCHNALRFKVAQFNRGSRHAA